ncbi:MAG: cell division protein FtsZ [Rikenellaceae bacterium]
MTEIIDCMNLDSAKDSNIMVIGVGGGGGNAVKYMYDIGIHNVYFMVCNTDAQALQRSQVPLKIQLGNKLTGGLGAGNKPEKGRDAALESAEEIKQQLVDSGVRMVFVTAGMGGGTGTGAAPVIAEIAKKLGILTVGIVTIPFRLEGPKRLTQAEKGLEEIKQHVDSLLVIDNENICKMYGDLDFSEAFGKADDILAIAAKGIAEAITKEHKVNVDFADVQTTMSNSGIALLGYASATIGEENVAIDLTERALLSPLLNQNNIHGAQDILINISWNMSELKMGELHAIIGHVQAAAGSNANIIWGAGADENLPDNDVSVIIIATGFKNAQSISLGDNIKTENFVKEKNTFTPTSEEQEQTKVIEIEAKDVEVVSLDDEPEVEEQQNDDTNGDDSMVIRDNTPDECDQTKQSTEQPTVSEPEYVSLEDEDHHDAAPATEQESENDGYIISTVDVKPQKVAPKPIEIHENLLFDDLDEQVPVSTNKVITIQKNEPLIQSSQTYTIDELENMPAYARRKAMLNIKSTTSNKKLKVDLDEK